MSHFLVCPSGDAPSRAQCIFRPEVSPVFGGDRRDLASVYDKVKAVGLPNYRGARVPLASGIKVEAWHKYADILPDKSLPDMLQYGFPSGHFATTVPATGLSNHGSARRNPDQVNRFLAKEVRYGALVGPFEAPLLSAWYRNNPLMMRSKCDSKDLRVILDYHFPLNWPLMGIDWDGGHYVDLAIPFGLRHGASACQRTSEGAAAISAETRQ